MNKEHKRKLRNISLLALVGLIGGTFAFQAFNQQAINDRLRDNEVQVGGRVHDYYNRDTENKEVFVENYGQEPIMARIRLSEFMEIQERGQTEFEPVVPDTERDEVSTWSTYIPAGDSINTRTGEGAARFNQYSKLTFGWERSGETAPWYLPTFNLDDTDLRTAAAGHARDYEEDGATHPGDGTDAYWAEDESHDNSAGTWPGSQVTRETAQNLPQDRAPLTLQQWVNLPNAQKIGDFWVIDHETGWAYWASQLQVGEASSYLLDAAQMTPEADNINGSYYYGIHVDSQLISPDRVFEDEPQEGHGGNLGYLLEGIRNNAVDDETGNPGAGLDSHPDDFDFSTMNPGRIFTMEGEEYRYLEDMENGNHMIIRNEAIRNVSFEEQGEILEEFYTNNLTQAVKDIVQPVAISDTIPSISLGLVQWRSAEIYGLNWLPSNWNEPVFNDIREDVTTVSQSGGIPQAFSLSFADVVHLSTLEGPFSNHAERVAARDSWWFLRTAGSPGLSWNISWNIRAGELVSMFPIHARARDGGVRPALIIHQ